MLCENCGKKLDSNTKFCPECGTRIKQPTENENVLDEKSRQSESIELLGEKMIEYEKLKEVIPKSQKKQMNFNSGVANFVMVSIIVALLVGTAFVISKPKENDLEYSGITGNNSVITNENKGTNNKVNNNGTDVENENNANISETTDKNENTSENLEIVEGSEIKEEKPVIKRKEEYDNGRLYNVHEYDENGNEILWCYYSGNVSRDERYYEYDELGNEIHMHLIEYDSNNQVEDELWNYLVYDKNGNLSKETYESLDGEKSVYTYTYDSKKRITSKDSKRYYSNGDIYCSYYTVSYKEKNNIISNKTIYFGYDKDAERYYETGAYDYEEIEYDEAGNIIKRTETGFDEQKEVESQEHEAYKYDKHGNLLEKTETSNNSNSYENYTYNEVGNVVSSYRNYYINGILKQECNTVYEYDAMNKCIKRSESGIDNTMMGMEGEYTWIENYEYDAEGNLLIEKSITNYPNVGKSEFTTYYTYY